MKKKNCSELFFFHESIRDCRGNEDDSSIVSIPFLWNIIIFRKHSKLGNIFRESFTETIIIFARYGHRQPQVLGNLYEVSQNSPGTSIHGHLSNIGSIPLGSKGITHLSIGVNIDPPLIGTIFDRKPRSSSRNPRTLLRSYDDSKFIQAILSLFNVEKTWNKYRSFCTLTETSELFAMQHIINRKLGVSLQFRPRMDHLVFFQWMEFTSVRDKKDKRGRIQSRGIEKRALGLLIRRPRIRSLRITGVSSPPNCSPSL